MYGSENNKKPYFSGYFKIDMKKKEDTKENFIWVEVITWINNIFVKCPWKVRINTSKKKFITEDHFLQHMNTTIIYN